MKFDFYCIATTLRKKIFEFYLRYARISAIRHSTWLSLTVAFLEEDASSREADDEDEFSGLFSA